jgi:hypothetical protein
MTTSTILAALQSAWGSPPVTKTSIAERFDLQGAGIAIERCETHTPPFDAIETTDVKRRGWMRSTCRRCGRLLGYRPTNHQDTIQYAEARPE